MPPVKVAVPERINLNDVKEVVFRTCPVVTPAEVSLSKAAEMYVYLERNGFLTVMSQRMPLDDAEPHQSKDVSVPFRLAACGVVEP